MLMITHDHIKYLHDVLEPDDGYPYPELYAQSDNYIQAHNVPNKYADSTCNIPKHLIYLIKDFQWKDRYSTLVQHGTFFENIMLLESLRYDENNEEKWRVSLDLKNIP